MQSYPIKSPPPPPSPTPYTYLLNPPPTHPPYTIKMLNKTKKKKKSLKTDSQSEINQSMSGYGIGFVIETRFPGVSIYSTNSWCSYKLSAHTS